MSVTRYRYQFKNTTKAEEVLSCNNNRDNNTFYGNKYLSKPCDPMAYVTEVKFLLIKKIYI